MSCKPFKTSEANAKAFLKTKGVIDNFLNVIDLGSFRNLHITLRQQAKTKYFPNVEGWNEKLFFENETGTKIYPNKEVFKKIDNINAIKTSIEKKEKAKLLKEEKERKIKEARLQQMRDAKRKGEPYSDEYLFEKTKKIGEPMEKKLRETYFKDSDKRKASDVLEEISKSNHPLNKLAKKLLPYIKENNVDIELSEDSYDFKLNDGTETTAAGIYSHSEKKIILFKNKQYNAIEKLILHESLHAVSNYQLKQNTKTNNDFKKLFEHAKENLPSSYELENIDEFLVGIFSDSRFINELKKLPPIEIKKYDNFLEEILDHLLSFLGFKKETTLYEQAFSIASNILEEQKNYLEQQRIANEEWEEYLNVMPNEPLFSPAEEVKPGVSELFESNPELANAVYEALRFNTIKTLSKEEAEKVDKIFKKYPELATLFNDNKELYNSYLKSIFPNSSEEFKGKLFFHGTKNPIEGGKFKISDRNLAKGLWFTKQLGYAKKIENYKDEGDTPITYGVVLNISNPKHFYNSSGALLVQRPSDFEKQYDRKNNDAAVFHHPESSDGKFTNEGGYNQIVVFDENQVHIIGDENDINKAKEFLANQITPQQKQQAQQQYSQYLDTIFPDSKVKDILYHGTPYGGFDKFEIDAAGQHTGSPTKGVYFTDSIKTATFYAEGSIDFDQYESREEYEMYKTDQVYSVLLNVKNLKLIDNPQGQEKQGDAILRTKKKLHDSGLTGYSIDLAHQYIVFDSEQIHILGSKQDIEGFKEFVEEKQTSLEPTEIKTEKDVVSLEIENQIDELIKLGIIKSKCN